MQVRIAARWVTVMGEVVYATVDLVVDLPTRISQIEHEVNRLLAADCWRMMRVHIANAMPYRGKVSPRLW